MILGVTGTGATNIVVRRPDNTIVQPNDPNVTRVAVSTGAIYSILSPAVGNWSVTITGTGLGMNHQYISPVAYEASVAYATSTSEVEDNESHGPSAKLEPSTAAEPVAPAMQAPEQFGIRVAGESTIHVSNFEFLELVTGGAHPGFKPLTGDPIAGRIMPVAAKLVTEGASTDSIQFRGLDGTVLQTLSLQEMTWPGDNPALPLPRETHFKEYTGDITVPNVPFQVYVTGTTNSGSQYQRVVPGVVRPQTLEIISAPVPNLHPGQSFTYDIQVKNSGAGGTFQLTAVDDLGFLAGASPTNFSLNTNETKSVKVQIDVPANAVPLSLDNLRFVVEGSSSNASATVGPFSIAEVPALRLGSFTVTPIGGDGDAFLDPGEGATLSVQLINDGTNTATNVRAGLSTSTAGAIVSQNFSDYPSIAPSANGTNLTPYVFYVPPNIACGQAIQLALTTTSEGNGSASVGEYNFSVSVGQPTFTNATRSYTGPVVAIPDNNASGVNVPLTVSGTTGQIEDLNFRIDGTTCNSTTTVGINHSFVADLIGTLRSPGGTTISLFETVDGSGDHFCKTVLDDQATNSIQNVTSANAPFTGSFRAKRALNIVRGENANGVWTLNVMDNEVTDVGSVRAFSLLFANAQYSCNAAPADTTAPSCTLTDFRPGPPASADITTQDTGTGIASIHVRTAENIDVVVPPFTPGTTMPIVVSGTLIDPNLGGVFEIESVDVAGNVSTCERAISATQPQITFRTNRDGNYELYVMNDDGSNVTRLTNTTTDEERHAWAPNGQKIAFTVVQDGANWWDILLMNPDGSNRVNLTQNTLFENYFGWSADSTKIAFESDRDGGEIGLWVMNADGTGFTRLIDTYGAEKPPAWSPNGQKIAFVSYANSVNNKPDIWLINPDGSGAVNLTQTAATESIPVWSPDGTKILFGRRSSNLVPFDIYVMNADGSAVQFLATGSTLADYQWSPDGTKIAFLSNRDGNFEIYVMNANGTNQVRLTNDPAFDSGPLWSADGQRILFHTQRTGNPEIFMMNADGSNQVNLTNNAATDGSGRWRP
jgi:Tol biopolymer transport system component/subtilisin-like proprotein convertase family protein